MIRHIHRWPGLVAAVFLIVLAFSGAALSVLPAWEHLTAPQAEKTLTVGDLTSRIMENHPGVEQIRRAASGRITAYWFEADTPGSALIDPATGLDAASADPSPVKRWLTELHRSLFLGDNGRIATAVTAAAMLLLALSGIFLVARRLGGFRRWFRRSQGPMAGRLHVELARFAVAGLLLSSLTALYMTASTFGYLPDDGVDPDMPELVSGQTGIQIASIAAFQTTPVAALRELSFPYPDDPTDVFTLKTDAAILMIDQGTGETLVRAELTTWEKASEFIFMLHTGQGAATLGLILGLMSLAVPVMAATGVLIWFGGRKSRHAIKQNAAAAQAETVLLVASEGGSTWGFAATLHAALQATGQKVHVAPLARFAPDRYVQAKRVVILAATYGDGEAPAAAAGFLTALAALPHAPKMPLAVLGFGDRSFGKFCAFASDIKVLADQIGWAEALAFDTIDRQSPQDFARWGKALGATMGLPLELVHLPGAPASHDLTLISRQDFGAEVQAPTAILRFAVPQVGLVARLLGRGFGRFDAGDLIGILPEGSAVPRFYSLASGSRDGFVEICVRKHLGGLCSGQLMALEPGQSLRGFVRANPAFRPQAGRRPVILIGAGTGIGPLAGFVRANARHQPLHLFFGARHPDSDMLYGPDLQQWHDEGKLTSLRTAFSRLPERVYVQDALRKDGLQVARLIAEGAQVLVCGGREMAAGVSAVLAEVLAPSGMTPALLKSQGRYREDVY